MASKEASQTSLNTLNIMDLPQFFCFSNGSQALAKHIPIVGSVTRGVNPEMFFGQGSHRMAWGQHGQRLCISPSSFTVSHRSQHHDCSWWRWTSLGQPVQMHLPIPYSRSTKTEPSRTVSTSGGRVFEEGGMFQHLPGGMSSEEVLEAVVNCLGVIWDVQILQSLCSLKGDLAELYETMNRVEMVHKALWFTLCHHPGSRGYSMKLKGSKFKTDTRKPFYIQCVTNLWNSLPQQII